MMLSSDGGDTPLIPRCNRLYQALCDCHRRFLTEHERDVACRHLNRALAACLISGPCPSESEAVRAFCASAGTAQSGPSASRPSSHSPSVSPPTRTFFKNPNLTPTLISPLSSNLANAIHILFTRTIAISCSGHHHELTSPQAWAK